MKKYNPHTTAKKLHTHQTDAEKLLWSILRSKKLGCKFRRQHPIDQYIVDFVSIERGLIIEVDGGQHTEDKDRARTEHLQGRGYRILRFWNDEMLKNKEGVYEIIQKALKEE